MTVVVETILGIPVGDARKTTRRDVGWPAGVRIDLLIEQGELEPSRAEFVSF